MPDGGAACRCVVVSSVPVPILVLGAMSLMLLGAGGLGYISRRRREQRGLDS